MNTLEARNRCRKRFENVILEINTIESARFPRLASLFVGGWLDGWPFRSVEAHLLYLEAKRHHFRQWLDSVDEHVEEGML